VPAIKGNTVVVLEQNAVLRLGIEALLESWGCQVVSGDNLDDIIADTRADNLRPTVLLLPPTNGQETGDQLASRFEAEIGYPLPWIGITGDSSLLQRWKAGAFSGILLEMPCSPETLRAALLKALRQKHGSSSPPTA
jgi:DNA-binding NtrC family response regulator